MPKMLYACEVFDIEPRALKQVQAKLAKKVLGVYDTTSTTACLRFIGWHAALDTQHMRCASFLARLLVSPYPELSSLARDVLCDAKPLPWAEKAGRALKHLELSLDSVLDAGDETCSVVTAAIKAKHPKSRGHPAFTASPHTARATFMFSLDDFNPIDCPGQLCVFCGEGPDCAKHLLECKDWRVRCFFRQCMEDLQVLSHNVSMEDVARAVCDVSEEGECQATWMQLEGAWEIISWTHQWIWLFRKRCREKQ